MTGYFFFFNDTATTEIYPLPLHDALPIFGEHDRRKPPPQLGDELGHVVEDGRHPAGDAERGEAQRLRLAAAREDRLAGDRKSTRLNSSHANISYAVFCLKKKKKDNTSRWT